MTAADVLAFHETLSNWGRWGDEDQLGALVCLIALINVYNRLNVITRHPAGDVVGWERH